MCPVRVRTVPQVDISLLATRERNSSRKSSRGRSHNRSRNGQGVRGASQRYQGPHPGGQKGKEIQTLHKATHPESSTHHKRVAVFRLWTNQLDDTQGVSPVPHDFSKTRMVQYIVLCYTLELQGELLRVLCVMTVQSDLAAVVHIPLARRTLGHVVHMIWLLKLWFRKRSFWPPILWLFCLGVIEVGVPFPLALPLDLDLLLLPFLLLAASYTPRRPTSSSSQVSCGVP